MGMSFERLQARDQGFPGQRMGLSHYYWIKHEERGGSGEASPKSGFCIYFTNIPIIHLKIFQRKIGFSSRGMTHGHQFITWKCIIKTLLS